MDSPALKNNSENNLFNPLAEGAGECILNFPCRYQSSQKTPTYATTIFRVFQGEDTLYSLFEYKHQKRVYPDGYTLFWTITI